MKPQSSLRNAKNRRASRKNRPARRSFRYSTLTTRQKATYERCLKLLSDLRRHKGTYEELLHKYHLRDKTARWYLGRDLVAGTGGKPVRGSKGDRRVRDLMFPTSVGDVPFRTRNSHDATTLSDYYHDRDQLLNGEINEHQFERKWRGVQVQGRDLFTDVDEIFRMADAGELKIEDLYASTGGAL